MKEIFFALMLFIALALAIVMLENAARANYLQIESYRSNYFLYGNNSAIDSKQDIKFQLSIRKSFWSRHLNFAYEQQSLWNIKDKSSPFRDSNYRPQAFTEFSIPHYTTRAGYRHESNGRERPASRSWERAFLYLAIEQPFFILESEAWIPFWMEQNDLPNYQGRWEETLTIKYKQFSIKSVTRFKSQRTEFLWNLGDFALFFQQWNGMGESLLEYDRPSYASRIGLAL